MKSVASLPCPTCERPIREILDLPLVSVDRVLCLELRQKNRERWARKPAAQTPLEQRLARRMPGMIYSERDDEGAALRSEGRLVAASDAVRGYLADLRALSGRTVVSSALLPPWQKDACYLDAPPVPGSPVPEYSGGWAVDIDTCWQAVGLGARVDVDLVHRRRNSGERGGALARVWVRGQLNPCGTGGP